MTASSDRSLPPGNFGLPWIGETIAFLREPDFSIQRHATWGPVFKTRLFGQPTIFLKGADAHRWVFSQEPQSLVVKWPASVERLLGPASLVNQTGDVHKQRRRLMAKAFGARVLAGYLDKMDAITRDYCERWVQLGEFAWYPELRAYTFDTACKFLVNVDRASERPLGQWFDTWSEGLFSIALNLPWTKFGRAWQARQHILQDIAVMVQNRLDRADQTTANLAITDLKTTDQATNHQPQDALSLLMAARDEDGHSLSVEELQDQILVLMFAGHETLTSSLTSFCLLTAQHPEVLDRLRAEQGAFDPDRPLTTADLDSMTYLDWTLREVLRFITPVGGLFRTTIAPTHYGGYDIPEGWLVLSQIHRTHEEESLYPNADRFDPDRWDPDRAGVKDPMFGYVPFGGGMRECLGKEFARLEIRLLAARLLQRYDWQLLPEQDLSLKLIPSPRPRDGLRVRFQRRS